MQRRNPSMFAVPFLVTAVTVGVPNVPTLGQVASDIVTIAAITAVIVSVMKAVIETKMKPDSPLHDALIQGAAIAVGIIVAVGAFLMLGTPITRPLIGGEILVGGFGGFLSIGLYGLIKRRTATSAPSVTQLQAVQAFMQSLMPVSVASQANAPLMPSQALMEPQRDVPPDAPSPVGESVPVTGMLTTPTDGDVHLQGTLTPAASTASAPTASPASTAPVLAKVPKAKAPTMITTTASAPTSVTMTPPVDNVVLTSEPATGGAASTQG